MSFKTRQPKIVIPPRHWGLFGYPNAGKTMFSTQMRGPILPIDADGRYIEAEHMVNSSIVELSAVQSDHSNPSRIADLLEEHMPGSTVGTIVIDSVTKIINPMVARAMQKKAEGKIKSLSAGMAPKAIALSRMQDVITKWGADSLYIWHLSDGRDQSGKPHTRETLSKVDKARLLRSLNMILEVIVETETDRRGIMVHWARRGRMMFKIWDDTGTWAGMPERIERAVYGNLTEEEQDTLEKNPKIFSSPELALAWGVTRGAFDNVFHAEGVYIALKDTHHPRTAAEMAALWVSEIEERLGEGGENGD